MSVFAGGAAGPDPGLLPVPSGRLPLSVRAPGKCILFGEHAVVHGRPELVLAIDLYTQVTAQAATATSLNGDPEAPRSHRYLAEALRGADPPPPPMAITAVSRIPRSAGLGSSAAFSSAVATVLAALGGGISRPALAQRAFGIERGAQGVGSPGDTSASVAGGYLTINAGDGPVLWNVEAEGRRWTARRVADPGWSWAVAYSGVPRDTGATVRAVGERLAQPDGPALLERFERVALEGIQAVGAEERGRVGTLLRENQVLLREVGVSHPRLERLLAAVEECAEGAKLTGAGAGGSIVALPKMGRELETVRRLTRAGGVAFLVRPARQGVEPIESRGAPPVEPAPRDEGRA
jgi:mevalonate kinase